MLLYQLDAWVLEGDIEKFLELNYDYIGAPIFKHNYNKDPEVIVGGGNGGVTLRKISSALNVLNNTNAYFSAKKYFNIIGNDYNIYKNPIKYIFKRYFSYFIYFNTNASLWPFALQEDVFWSVIIPDLFQKFNVPNLEIASKFSFDLYPSKVYNYSKCLPLFIHAWEKNNDGFFDDLHVNDSNELVIKVKN